MTGHHVIPVGRGGKDVHNVVPACSMNMHAKCHGQVWNWSQRRVEEEYGLDLREEARRITEDFVAKGYGPHTVEENDDDMVW